MATKKENLVKYKYPTQFGSHSSMINKDETAKLSDKTKVVIEDEFGTYITDLSRVDDWLADPNRYVESRLSKLFEKRHDESI